MTAAKGAGFVKSAGTSTSVLTSKLELERMLRRYGAHAFSTAQDYKGDRAVVMFQIANTPEKGAKIVDVRFPVETRRVYDRLFGRPTRWGTKPDGGMGHVFDPNGYNAKKLEQAERVAWRNVILWVDAQLSAASVGIQTAEEAFIAHVAIGPNGERLIDRLPDLIALDTRRMLGSGDDAP